MDKKEITNFLFKLFLEKENLGNLDREITELFTLCKSDDEYFLVKHAIQNLFIVSPGKVSRLTSRLTSLIKEKSIENDALALVAMSYDDQPDSSQQVLQLIKPQLIGVKNVKFFNSIPNYLKKDNIVNFPNFMLIDDFSGTGKTVINRVKHIRDNAKSRGIEVNSSVGILVGMQVAKKNIEVSGLECHFIVECLAGISGHFSGADRAKYIECMKRMEEELCPQIGSAKIPSLGYGEAEALFCVEGWNAPNSNFPILWWPKDRNMNDRQTVMQRFEL